MEIEAYTLPGRAAHVFPDDDGLAPPPWIPLSKAQCLLMAIELRREHAAAGSPWHQGGLGGGPERAI